MYLKSNFRPLHGFVLAIVVGIAITLAAIFFEWNDSIDPDVAATYVGRASCIECHQEQADTFHNSHHDRAMDVATDATVLGKFDGQQIEHFGIISTVFRDGNRFMVNTDGPDGELADFEVKMVFGCEPLQQYMVEIKPPDGNQGLGQLQVLRLSWDTVRGEWFYLSPPDVNDRIEPDDPLHWTGITQRWNTNCAVCHSTNLKKNFNPMTKTYATSFSEIDVSCEACHGPGSLHVEMANQRRFLWDRNHGYGLVKLKSTSNLPEVESCAPCHSRRGEIFAGHQAGQPYNDFFACQTLSDRLYHDDGQIRDEDYVYGSFIQSRMFHHGIRCTDCHDPHSTRIKHEGNQLCTSCHQHPAGKYDSPSHHRHPTGSPGALCVECHMPATTYMAVDARRDHSLRVPRPDLSVEFGTPNACTACHLDTEKLPAEQGQPLKQYLDWIIAAESNNQTVAAELDRVNRLMADAFNKWYPEGATNPQRSRYYEQLVIGKSQRADSRSQLMQLATERSAPAMFRASAIEQLTEDVDEESAAKAEEALGDPDPKVVAAALGHLNSYFSAVVEQAQFDPSPTSVASQLRPRFRVVNPLLAHGSRLVRIEAARMLSLLPGELRNLLLDPADRKTYSLAIAELREGLLANNDLAGSHMVLGNLSAAEGQLQQAENSYRTALSVEPNFVGSRTNIAASLDAKVAELRNRLSQSPESPLSTATLTQIEELENEARQLRRQENQLLATEVSRLGHMPEAHSLFYRYGLSCYIVGQLELAEEYLRKAHALEPNNSTYLLGLAAFYNQQGTENKALEYANQLLEIDPQHQGCQRLRAEIMSAISTRNTGE